MKKLAIVLLGALSVSAYAEKSQDDSFKADLELGAIVTSGNTDTTSLKGKASVKQELKKWRMAYVIEGLYKKDEFELIDTATDEVYKEERTTAQKYFASAQADYKLNEEHRGLFVFGSHEDDRFSGYDSQSTISLGYSDRLFGTENSTFDYSVGPGMSFTTTSAVFDRAGNIVTESEDSSTVVIRAAFEYIYQISENAKFSQTLASDLAVDTEENSRTRSATSVSANINSTLAMKLSYLVDQNTHVAPGKFHADRQAVMTLVFSF